MQDWEICGGSALVLDHSFEGNLRLDLNGGFESSKTDTCFYYYFFSHVCMILIVKHLQTVKSRLTTRLFGAVGCEGLVGVGVQVLQEL